MMPLLSREITCARCGKLARVRLADTVYCTYCREIKKKKGRYELFKSGHVETEVCAEVDPERAARIERYAARAEARVDLFA